MAEGCRDCASLGISGVRTALARPIFVDGFDSSDRQAAVSRGLAG